MWDIPKMRAVEELHKSQATSPQAHKVPSLAWRVPHGLPRSGPLVGRVPGCCADTRGQDTGCQRDYLPQRVAWKKCSGSLSCMLGSWF